MSDWNDIIRSMERHRRVLAKANELNKTAVFDALAAAGITHVVVDFDGEGDSGQLEQPAVHADGKLLDFPDSKITIHAAQYGKDDLASDEVTLRYAVEDLCYGYLSQEHGGWENNDGAYGAFTFDVAERRIELDFNARFTDATHFSHTF